MIITVLAVLFLLIMAAIAVFGYKMIITQGPRPEDINREKCSVCRKKFNKNDLVLRTIGDYKLLYFCEECIGGLYTEAKAKYNGGFRETGQHGESIGRS